MRLTTLYTTLPDIDSARLIATTLVEKEFVACCNFWPISSIYKWKGCVEEAQEVALLCKTYNKQKAFNYIQSHHPYDVPLILNQEAEVNDVYGNWMKGNQ